MSEIKVKDKAYRCGKLNAFIQLHISRRLGPALLVAGISVEMLRAGKKVYFQDMVSMAGPVMEFVGKMKDEDVDYVLRESLRVVQRQEGDKWAPVTAPGTTELMYEDIDMVVLLRLVVEVLSENLGSFLTELGDGLPSTSS